MFTIGHLAQRAGVGIETIRFYEREALLDPTSRTDSGYRLYDDSAVKRLKFIRRAKALGFTLGEIRELLTLQDDPTQHADRAAVRAIATRRLEEIERRVKELTQMRKVLKDLAKRCSGHGPLAGCPIIEALSEQ